MSYTLRFTSNAYQADKCHCGKMLARSCRLKKQAKRALKLKSEIFEVGNRWEDLYGISQRTFERAMDWADVDFDQQMSAVKWKWKGSSETLRENGETVTEPRDIVDMGTLLQSKQRKQAGRNVVDFEWTADHAELVHDGAAALKSGGYYPARPWTNPTIEDIDEVIDGILRNGGK
jgi:hypothetical protein